MARIKKNTLSEKISLTVPAIQLPRSSIHDKYILDIDMTIANASASSVTPTAEQVLTAIESITLTSDSTRVHYAVSGLDVARRNAIRTGAASVEKAINKTFSAIAASASGTCNVKLVLDEGDILAVAHDSLELKVAFNTAIDTGVTVSAATVTTTITEIIPSAEELTSWYGKNFEYVAEPKVYSQTVSIPANTELTGVFDIPTGTLLNAAMLYFTTDPQVVGILQTVPDRVELMREDYDVLRFDNELKYKATSPAGVVMLEYGSEWYDNSMGVPAWTYNKGDRQISVKSSASTTLRYTSFERIVNIDAYNKTGIANIGSTAN